MTFWEDLPKPIVALAPMADVTDPAFRRIIAKYGKPDVLWTEFVSADGLFLGGYDALVKDLDFTQAERPIVAQFFTSNPDMMRKAASLARDLGFDGIDINMGCPDKRIERRGAGANLMKYPELAQRAGVEGTVWVKIWVDKEGKPRKALVLKSTAELFNQAAVDAAMKWVFTPALMRNGPVSVWVSIPFKFMLSKK